MGKLMLYFFMMALVLHISFAESKIFSGTVITDTDKTVETYKFRFNYDETAKKAFVTTPTTNMIIDHGSCKSNNVFKVCINSANFSYRNITTYQSYYELKVDIYKLTGSLTTDLKATSTKLLQNEPVNATITIANPTNLEVNDIDFLFDPSNFSIIAAKGCTLSGNELRWKGTLNPNYDKACTAVLIAPPGAGTYSIGGKVSYFNGFEKENTTINAVSITVLPKQLKFTGVIDNTTNFTAIEAGDSFHLNVSIKNTHESEEMSIVAIITLPSNTMLLKDLQTFDKSGNIFRKSFVLKPKQEFNYSLYMKALGAGTDRILNSYSYKIKYLNENVENSTSIEVIEPRPAVELIPEYSTIKPGQKFIVIAKLSNPSRKYDFTKISSRLNVPFNMEVSQALEKLGPNQSYTIISKVFLLPEDAQIQNSIRVLLETDYLLNSIFKSINKSIELKVTGTGNEDIAQETTPGFNESIQQATQQPAAPSSAPETPASEPITTQSPVESISPLNFPKTDFSSPKVWIITAFIFLILFVAPGVIYKIKKKKQPVQQPQQPQQEEQQGPQPK